MTRAGDEWLWTGTRMSRWCMWRWWGLATNLGELLCRSRGDNPSTQVMDLPLLPWRWHLPRFAPILTNYMCTGQVDLMIHNGALIIQDGRLEMWFTGEQSLHHRLVPVQDVSHAFLSLSWLKWKVVIQGEWVNCQTESSTASSYLSLPNNTLVCPI